jgi:hypothetical protein
VSCLKKVTKQRIVSYIKDSYQENVSLHLKKEKLISLLQSFYKRKERQENSTIPATTEDLFGNPIINPCVGNDNEIYDMVSMEYLFQKDEEGSYVNIPYQYNAERDLVPNFPRMKSGIRLSSYISLHDC